MRLFIDTTDLDEIWEAMSWGALSSVTANPSLYAKTGGKLADFKQHMVKICEVCKDLPVSAESTAMAAQETVEEGKRLARLAPNAVVKLPIDVESLATTKTFAEDGVAVNIVLVFSAPQALLTARAGARCISSFVGRVDDIGSDGVASLGEIVRCIHNYDFGHGCEIITASIRSPYHVTTATLMGADIATVPFGALKNCVKRPLTAEGLAKLETDQEEVKDAQVGVQVWRRRLEQRNHAPVLEESTAPRHSERVRRSGG